MSAFHLLFMHPLTLCLQVSGLRLPEINKLSVGAFMGEFSDFLATLALSPNQVVVAGDVNLLWNRVKVCTHGFTIQATLDILGLTQHVYELTHQDGNTLNWRNSRQSSCVDKLWVGDHISVPFVYTVLFRFSKHRWQSHSPPAASSRT